jgi:hypothetical protein
MTMTRETAEALSMFADTNPITDEDRQWLFSQILDAEEREREEAWGDFLEGIWVDPFEQFFGDF